MRSPASLLLLCGLALAAQSPATPPPQAPPRLQVQPPGRQDLGSAGPRERKRIEYTFTNTSGAPIRLKPLPLQAGVLVEGPALEEPIPPKGSAALAVILDATGHAGWMTRTVRFETDDPRQGRYQLPLAMTVRPDLTVDRERASFGEVAPHESPELVFTFRRETGDPTALRLESQLPPYLEAEFVPEGASTTLRLSLHPSRLAPGVLQGLESLTVGSNAPLQPRFRLYADWRLRHPVQADPERLVMRDPQLRSARLTLRSRDGMPLALRRAHVEGPGFTLGPLPAAPAPQLVLEVTRGEGPELRAMLVLSFEGEAAPLRIPLVYAPENRP